MGISPLLEGFFPEGSFVWLTFFTVCGGWNQFQQQQKGWYSLLVHVEDRINFNESKKCDILYFFMWRIESISTTVKAWYSLLFMWRMEPIPTAAMRVHGILYLLMLLDMYGDLFNFFWLFGTESRR